MKEYNYNGYTIKEVRRADAYGFGFGLTLAVYKGNKFLGYCDREGQAKATADWHARYGEEAEA